MDCPLARVHRTVQPWIAAVPALTVTWPWKPPDHEFVVWYVAEQPPAPGGVVDGGVVVAGGVVVGGVVGGLVVVGGVVGGVVPPPPGGSATPVTRLAASDGWKLPAA